MDPKIQTPVEAAAPVTETETARRHTEALRTKDAQIAKLQHELADFREMTAHLKTLPLLEGEDDPVKALQLVTQRLIQSEAECGRLLESAITNATAEAVKIESVRPVVASFIRDRKPTTAAQVSRYLAETLDKPAIKALLEAQVVIEAGPAHQRPATPPPAANAPKSGDGFQIPPTF